MAQSTNKLSMCRAKAVLQATPLRALPQTLHLRNAGSYVGTELAGLPTVQVPTEQCAVTEQVKSRVRDPTHALTAKVKLFRSGAAITTSFVDLQRSTQEA
jgi:hypothetical protein